MGSIPTMRGGAHVGLLDEREGGGDVPVQRGWSEARVSAQAYRREVVGSSRARQGGTRVSCRS